MRPPTPVSHRWGSSDVGATGRLLLLGLLLSLMLVVVGTLLGTHGAQTGTRDELAVSTAGQSSDSSVVAPVSAHTADCVHGGVSHPPEAGDCIMAVSPTSPLCSEPTPDAQPADADAAPVRARAEVDRTASPPLSLHALSISRV